MSDTALIPAAAPRPPTPRPMIRPERMPKPIEKAAMILTAIGPELGAGFLRERVSGEGADRAAALLARSLRHQITTPVTETYNQMGSSTRATLACVTKRSR